MKRQTEPVAKAKLHELIVQIAISAFWWTTEIVHILTPERSATFKMVKRLRNTNQTFAVQFCIVQWFYEKQHIDIVFWHKYFIIRLADLLNDSLSVFWQMISRFTDFWDLAN